ncbi:unknown protein [Seminavis robusta]|uniref:Uncharacterized protein n=1 Tax=Seminavis robusta TaxID=568900 RepID=A0A9N8HJD9_9STRA|nr:unknown protein [Seminavis robusta]|eukprot:Sro760_g198300.1 n/a (109) ;mRNA; r:4534-4940
MELEMRPFTAPFFLFLLDRVRCTFPRRCRFNQMNLLPCPLDWRSVMPTSYVGTKQASIDFEENSGESKQSLETFTRATTIVTTSGGHNCFEQQQEKKKTVEVHVIELC